MMLLSLVAMVALGAPAPAGTSLSDELRRARDDAAPLEDRLAAARRAYGLASSAETAALVKATFLDVERDQLARAHAFERLRTSCASPDAAPLGVERCVRELLARSSARAAFVEVRGDEVLSVALGVEPDTLHLVRGVVRRAQQQRGQLTLDLEVLRARMPRDALLEPLLFGTVAARARPSDFAGPVLSEGSRQLIAALPDHFTELAGAPGHRVIQDRCQAPPITRGLEASWLGQARVTLHEGAESSSETIVDAWKVERGVELALEGGRTLRMTWPTAEKNVAELGGVAWGTEESFPRKPAPGCPP